MKIRAKDRVDLQKFCQQIEELRGEVYSSVSYADFEHLKKIERRGRICSLLGYATVWLFPNLITAFLISFGQFTRWLLAHHILHKGYDRVPGIPVHYTSKGFAQGWRRFYDWFDWIHPAAWHFEHNILHHYHTGEDADPDLVERHVQFIHEARIPKWAKYVIVMIAGITWKYTYYAPNTISVIDPEHKKALKQKSIVYLTIKNVLDFRNKFVRRLWVSCYLPYISFRFVAIPACFLVFGTKFAVYALINMLLAECITNLHSFLVIGPNHTGSDIFKFNYHYEGKEQFLVHQVLGSVNYKTGNDLIDHLQIWLNYQIEHHLFPDLPMLQYQRIQPRVKAICDQHGIPYIQENIFVRFRKMTDICVGNAKMLQLDSYEDFPFAEAEIRPAHYTVEANCAL